MELPLGKFGSFYVMSKWLITGSGGFLGRTLTQQLVENGAKVTGLKICRNNSGTQAFDIVVSKLTSTESLKQALKGQTYDYVINLAAAGVHPQDRNPQTLEDINITLPASLVTISDDIGSPAYVFAGSCSEYAEPTEEVLLTETAPLENQKLYGSTKAIGNSKALAIAKCRSVCAVTARIFNLYGPGESEHRLIPSLLDALKSGQKPQLSDGLQVRDFMHVEDASNTLIALAHKLKASELGTPQTLNVCTGIATSVRDLAVAACESAGFPVDTLNFGAIERRPDDIAYLVGDRSKLDSYIGRQDFMSVKEGALAYVQVLLKNHRMREETLS